MNNPVLILYLEDNPRDAELVRDQLQLASMACELRVASDRAEYEAALAQTCFDLILSDYCLPDYDGLAALALARAKQPNVPFILISGTLGEEQAVDCLLCGATDYVLKQRPNRLVPAILRALVEAAERQKRRESEARYRALFNGSADGILVADIETKMFKYANPALSRMLGYTEDELRTMGVPDIHPKDAIQSVVAEFETLARGDKTLALDIPCLRKDGSVFYADINVTRITIDGRLCSAGFFRDITERKWAEEEREQMLRRQQGLSLVQQSLLAPAPLEDKLRSITDSIVRLFGADFCRIWLVRPGDLCARGCVHAGVKQGPQVCHHRDRCLHLLASSGRYTHIDGNVHRRVPFGAYKIGRIASGKDHKFQTNDVTSDPLVHNHEWARELGLVSFAGYQLRIPGAEALGVLALFAKHPILPAEDALLDGLSSTLAEVIQQAQAEAGVRASEAKYRGLFESSRDAIMTLEPPSWRFTSGNPATVKMFGAKSEEEFISYGPLKLSPERQPDGRASAEQSKEMIETTLREGSHFFEWTHWRVGGEEFPADVLLTRMVQGGKVIVQSTIRDLTEKRKIEAQLLRNQRIESVGRLTSGIAHDLNNILAPILMCAPLLRDEFHDPESLKMVDMIEASAQRGAAIIKQLLTFGRGTAGERVAVQFLSLVRDMVNIIRETFPKNITTRREAPPDVWLVSGDATQLHQVLLNLCVNARDAMPEGGTLTLELENVQIDETLARMNPGASPGRYVVLSVTDTGTGIPPENLDKVFDPFFTTKELGKGTGLGLSTVIGIVKSHRGFVTLNSKVGRGTQFRVYLPACEAPPDAGPPLKPESLPHGQGELVLIVDDEESVRRVARQLLERQGYRVLEAADGTEGLKQYAQHQAEIELVMADLAMPFMDGPAFIRALRQTSPQARIVAMSGLQSVSKIPKGLTEPVQAFLAKPFGSASLLQTVWRALHPETSGQSNATKSSP